MRNAIVQMLNIGNLVDRTSAAFDVNQAVSASFQIVNGDTDAAGTVKIQCNNSLVTNGNRATFVPPANAWSDIPGATSAIAAGVGPAIVIGNMAFSYVRAVFTSTTPGSSTITVNMNYLSC